MVAMVTVQRSFSAVTKVVKMVSERSPAVTLSADKIVSYTKLSVIYIHLRLCVFAAWPLISVSKLLQISNERFFEIPPIPPFIFIKTMKIASCRKLPVIYIHLHLCIYVAWLMLTLCVWQIPPLQSYLCWECCKIVLVQVILFPDFSNIMKQKQIKHTITTRTP